MHTLPRPPPLTIWLQAIRPRTLSAGVAPVAVAAALAAADGVFHPLAAAFALIGALALQIGTNLHNDYEDYVRGADGPDRIGPQRAAAMGWIAPERLKAAAIATFGAAALVGVYLILRGGWPILALGLASIAAGWSYTGGPRPLAYLGVADLFVLAFFGLAAVVGGYYVQALALTPAAWWLGLGVGALATAILAVNNLRDRDGDARVGKRTLAVRFGPRFARAEHSACVLAAHLVLLPVALQGRPGALAGLLALPLALRLTARVWRTDGPALNPLLGGTAKLLALYGALVSAGLLLAAELL